MIRKHVACATTINTAILLKVNVSWFLLNTVLPGILFRVIQQPMLHVSSNKSCDQSLRCYLCVPFQLASPPGFHVTHIPKGNLVVYTYWSTELTTYPWYFFIKNKHNKDTARVVALSRGRISGPVQTEKNQNQNQNLKSTKRLQGFRGNRGWSTNAGYARKTKPKIKTRKRVNGRGGAPALMHRPGEVEAAASPEKRGECVHTASRLYSAAARAPVS